LTASGQWPQGTIDSGLTDPRISTKCRKQGDSMVARVCLIVTALLAAGLFGSATPVAPAAADTSCARVTPLFAVEQDTGHLAELPYCPGGGFLAPHEVDTGDWRAAGPMIAATDGTTTVLYTVTPAGELWWRRLETDGTLGEPVRIGTGIDWTRYSSLFVSKPGFLHGMSDQAVATFAHPGWATGDPELTAESPLLDTYDGASMSALTAPVSFGEANSARFHYRIWRRGPENGFSSPGVFYYSGQLPAVTSVTGAEPVLFAITPSGQVASLTQLPWSKPKFCALGDQNPWQITETAAGAYSRVIASVSGATSDTPPAVAMWPANPGNACPSYGVPYEWQ
jgi:hypothetical protein